MNIDQRLHRAAHDLRELEIDVPPLAVGSTGKTRAPLRGLGASVAAAMLFALGGVMTVADMTPAGSAAGQVTVHDDDHARVIAAGLDTTIRDASPQLSAHEELAMISALSRPAPSDGRSGAIDPSIPPGAS